MRWILFSIAASALLSCSDDAEISERPPAAPAIGGFGGVGLSDLPEGASLREAIAPRIAATWAGTCALTGDGRVACWGGGSKGPWDYPRGFHAAAIHSGAYVVCWQYFGGGFQCFIPSDPAVGPPTLDGEFAVVRAGHLDLLTIDSAGRFFGDRVGEPALRGPETRIFDVAGSEAVLCGLDNDAQQVVCWLASSGKVPDPDPCEPRSGARGELSPPPGAFKQLSGGAYHFCGLRVDGSIDCWGAGDGVTASCEPEDRVDFGQTNAPQGTFKYVSAGRFHTCAVRTDGQAVCWGAGEQDGDCGGDLDCGMSAPPEGIEFEQVAAGYTHSCGLTAQGQVACWGSDTHGRSSPPPDLAH